MLIIRIGNKRNGDKGMYCGRPSKLGNPFIIGKSGDRLQVIAKYKALLDYQFEHDPEIRIMFKNMMDRIIKDGEITLVCWCHPEPCHTEVIARRLIYLLKRKRHNARLV